MNLKLNISKVVNTLAVVCFILGVISFYFVDIIKLINLNIDQTELPLSELTNIVVNKEGRLYCGLQSYSRVQVYDSQGKFLKNFYVDTDGGGDFRLSILKDNLIVAPVRNKMVYIYNKNEGLIKQYRDVEIYDKLVSTATSSFRDEKGNKYEIKNVHLFPRIIKTSPDGHSYKLVGTTIFKWLFKDPFPNLFFVIFSFGIFVYRYKRL